MPFGVVLLLRVVLGGAKCDATQCKTTSQPLHLCATNATCTCRYKTLSTKDVLKAQSPGVIKQLSDGSAVARSLLQRHHMCVTNTFSP